MLHGLSFCSVHNFHTFSKQLLCCPKVSQSKCGKPKSIPCEYKTFVQLNTPSEFLASDIVLTQQRFQDSDIVVQLHCHSFEEVDGCFVGEIVTVVEQPPEVAKGRFPEEVVKEVERMGPYTMSRGKGPRLANRRCSTRRYLNSRGPYKDFGLSHVVRLAMCCMLCCKVVCSLGVPSPAASVSQGFRGNVCEGTDDVKGSDRDEKRCIHSAVPEEQKLMCAVAEDEAHVESNSQALRRNRKSAEE